MRDLDEVRPSLAAGGVVDADHILRVEAMETEAFPIGLLVTLASAAVLRKK